MSKHTKHQVNWSQEPITALFSNMRFIVMFVTAVCVLFLIKFRWPKKKNFYLFLFYLFLFFYFYFLIQFFINFWFFDDPGCFMLFYRQFPGLCPTCRYMYRREADHEALIFIPPCVLSEPVQFVPMWRVCCHFLVAREKYVICLNCYEERKWYITEEVSAWLYRTTSIWRRTKTGVLRLFARKLFLKCKY